MSHKSGILKVKSKYDTAKTVDFLVFGYHCKLYRDDKKALELDRESHLIPAPYEPKDSISRYIYLFIYFVLFCMFSILRQLYLIRIYDSVMYIY